MGSQINRGKVMGKIAGKGSMKNRSVMDRFWWWLTWLPIPAPYPMLYFRFTAWRLGYRK
jgi:hypothetical protein